MHRHERRQLARVAEVVREETARQSRASRRLTSQHVDLTAGDLLAQERKREAGEVRAAADAADDDVGEGARELHLSKRLLTDHGLVQEHVVEDAPERVGGVLAGGRVLDGLRDRDPEAPRRVRMLLEDRPAGLRLYRRARDDLRAPSLDQRAPVRLLLAGDLDHVDLALATDHLAGERERAPPLPRAGLGRAAGP